MNKRSRVLGLALGLGVLLVAAFASAAPTITSVSGIRSGYHDTDYGYEFTFDIPVELASQLTPGDLLEPDELSQRIMYFGGTTGFCIDPDVPAGGLHTVYRVSNHRSERALAAAREAAARGGPRDAAIWAEMGARPEPRRANYPSR